MSANSIKSKKIFSNSLLLYGRMIIVMIINLYTVRLVLNALGVEDYGIYNVVAGIVTMLQSVSGVLATASQRFYSYSIGEKNQIRLNDIFSISLIIYAIFSVLVLLLGETIGLWFINTELVIPEDRLIAANWIYQFALLSFIISMLNIPFSSATIAHEDMNVFAFISIIECLFKLITAILLPFLFGDSLILYGGSFVVIAVFSFSFYIIISKRRYQECHYSKPKDINLYKELLSFSGWSLFGSVAGVGMNQVCNIITNIFFGPMANASRAIAFQINGAISSFSASFLMAVRPPMIKAYAENEYEYLNKLFYLSNKLIYFGLLIIILPLYIEMNTILLLWLNIEDEQTILFARLILVYTLIMALNNPISIVIQATGHVKQYHIWVEFFTLLCVPATYILFHLGFSATSSFVVMIIAALMSHVVRMICLKKYYPFYSNVEYIKSFIVPVIIITFFASIILCFLCNLIEHEMMSIFISFILSAIIVIPMVFWGAMSSVERISLLSYVKLKHS